MNVTTKESNSVEAMAAPQKLALKPGSGKAARKPAATVKKTAEKTPVKATVKKPAKPVTPAKAAKVTAKPPVKAASVPVAKPATKKVAKAATASESKPANVPLPVKTAASKPVKIKLVRDSFTMPSDEYAMLAELKQRALSAAHPAKKSELLRAGIKLLSGLGAAALLRALKDVPAIKTGRPKAKKSE